MSTNKLHTVLIVIFVTWLNSHAQSLSSVVYDDFTSPAINTNKWEIRKTFADSDVFASSNNAVLLNRGKLLPKTASPTNLVIRTRLNIAGNQNDVFRIMWRTDGDDSSAGGNGSRELRNGLRVTAQLPHSENGFAGSIALDWINYPIDGGVIASIQTNLQPNTFYNVRITDNGSEIKVFLGTNSTPLLTGIFSNRFGTKIAFYNREGAAGGSSISAGSQTDLDYVDIQDASILRLSINVSKVKVSGNLLVGTNYVLESSFDMSSWSPVGPSFTATNDTFTSEFDVDVTGRFFRLRQTP